MTSPLRSVAALVAFSASIPGLAWAAPLTAEEIAGGAPRVETTV